MQDQRQAVLSDGLFVGQGEDVVGPAQERSRFGKVCPDGPLPRGAVGVASLEEPPQFRVACGGPQVARRLAEQGVRFAPGFAGQAFGAAEDVPHDAGGGQGLHGAGGEIIGAAQGGQDGQFQDQVHAVVDGGCGAAPLVEQGWFAVLHETAAQDGDDGRIGPALFAKQGQLPGMAVVKRIVFHRQARRGARFLQNQGAGHLSIPPIRYILPNQLPHIIMKT